MRERIPTNFGTIDPSDKAGRECWSDYQRKLEKWHAHRTDFEMTLKDESSLRQELQKDARSPLGDILISTKWDRESLWNEIWKTYA